MRNVGLVSLDQNWKWAGGRYYLHHLIRAVNRLPESERLPLVDVYWGRRPLDDAFLEVRAILDDPVEINSPAGALSRLARRARNLFSGQVDARDLFKRAGVDVCFPLPPCENSGVPYVFWLPDFQYLRRPDLLTVDMRDHLESYISKHVHAAAQIILSSNDARADFATVYPAKLCDTHVVRFCSIPDEDWWRSEPQQIASKFNLPSRYFVVCNQFTRHKNHVVLIRALAALPKNSRIDIVCTGSTFDHRGEDYAEEVRQLAANLGVSEHLHILGLLPRHEQIAIVRGAIAVLQPSMFEGWSTVIEDAKSLGKVVVASSLPVHREQLGALHPFLLGESDEQAWAEALHAVASKAPHSTELCSELQAEANTVHASLECGRAFVKAIRSAIELTGKP